MFYGGKEYRYKAEQKRFQNVLTNASDEALFITLKYAIAYGYVPNSQVDPFYNRYVMVGVWQRSLMVFDTLRNRRTDLLREIYPDMDVLDEYVRWSKHTERSYKDTTITNTILQNVGQREYMDSLMGRWDDSESLFIRFYGTPYL